MGKKYIVSESQIQALISKKKVDKNIANKILNEIHRMKNSLNESKIASSATVDILNKYKKKGLITKGVNKYLVESDIEKKELLKAGLIKD